MTLSAHQFKRAFVISLVSCLLLLFGLTKIKFGYSIVDSVFRILFYPQVATVWAPQFKEESFGRISLGMSEQEMKKLVGEALNTTCFGGVCWHQYSVPKYMHKTVYDVRQVAIKDGRVIKVVHAFRYN